MKHPNAHLALPHVALPVAHAFMALVVLAALAVFALLGLAGG